MNLAVKALAWALWSYLDRAPFEGLDPEKHEALGPIYAAVRHRLGMWPWTQEGWEEALMDLLAEEIAEKLAKGWDRYGAPTAARHPTEEGRWVGSFEGPGKPYTVEASSKREAYRLARREWVKRLLDRTRADKGAD